MVSMLAKGDIASFPCQQLRSVQFELRDERLEDAFVVIPDEYLVLTQLLADSRVEPS
jgi:hypothetical protein